MDAGDGRGAITYDCSHKPSFWACVRSHSPAFSGAWRRLGSRSCIPSSRSCTSRGACTRTSRSISTTSSLSELCRTATKLTTACATSSTSSTCSGSGSSRPPPFFSSAATASPWVRALAGQSNRRPPSISHHHMAQLARFPLHRQGHQSLHPHVSSRVSVQLTSATLLSCSASSCELRSSRVADARFRYPGAGERYPGILHVDDYNWMQRIGLSAVPYCMWQLTYWKVSSNPASFQLTPVHLGRQAGEDQERSARELVPLVSSLSWSFKLIPAFCTTSTTPSAALCGESRRTTARRGSCSAS